jgi:hypothetical protein
VKGLTKVNRLGRFLAGLVVCAAGCGVTATSGDSESHFLRLCTDECGELSCICGVCTQACDDDDVCQGLADTATCQDVSATCGDDPSAPTSACDVGCENDDDCGELGAGYTCDSGECRYPAPEGSGGSNGAGASSNAGGSGAGPNTPCCVEEPISWGLVGGYVIPFNHSVGGCASFNSGATLDVRCESELPACGEGIGVDARDLRQAMKHPDVLAALAAAPIRYGRDTTQVDGAMLAIEIGGDEITIGYECNGEEGCIDLPEGVYALLRTLNAIATQQTSSGDCGADPCNGEGTYDPDFGGDCLAMGGDQCFNSVTEACVCTCAASESPLDNCAASKSIPPIVACGKE